MKNKQGNVAVVAVIIIIVAITAGVVGWMFAKKSQAPAPQIATTQSAVDSNSTKDRQLINNQTSENSQKALGQDIYFGSSANGKYSFVNVVTKSQKDLLPAGYEIVAQHNYGDNPQFLILKKSNQLFSFSVQNGSLQKIENGTLKNAEDVVLYPSLTEKGKFYLAINTMKNVENGMYSAVTTSSRKYFLDTAENKLRDAGDISLPGIGEFSGCFVYDSKYSRFFIWSCGEGIGNTIPLSTYSLADKKQKEIIGAADFGKNNESISVQQGNGNFLAMSKSKDGFLNVVVATPTENVTKETFQVTERVKNQLNETYPYSNLFIKDKKTIVVGGGSFILLMKFDDNNEVVESKYLTEPEIYANFIFTDGQKIYYKSKNQIKVVNLETWIVEKILPLDEGSEEINIFAFPKQ